MHKSIPSQALVKFTVKLVHRQGLAGYEVRTLICLDELSQVSVVAGKLSLPLVWVFAGRLHQPVDGGT